MHSLLLLSVESGWDVLFIKIPRGTGMVEKTQEQLGLAREQWIVQTAVRIADIGCSSRYVVANTTVVVGLASIRSIVDRARSLYNSKFDY